MTNRPKILVVEDSEDVLQAISLVLKDAGLQTVEARDGRVALKVLFEARPDCVVLDINLPELDGWKVLARIRDMSDVPVLMLTARHDEADKVRGLERGADDYMTKPFSNLELIARVNALMRRSRTPAMAQTVEIISDGPLTLDPAKHTAFVAGEPVALTSREFNLFCTLAQHRGQVLTPTQLLDIVWKDSTGTSPDRVKFVVYRLRQKLEAAGLGRTVIEAVRGVGYRYTTSA